MFDDQTLDTWKRAEAGTAPISREDLERVLRSSARRSGRTLNSTLLIYSSLPMGAALLAAANVALFAGDTNMVALELAIVALALASTGHSLSLLLRLRREDPSRWPLVESLRRRLELYERSFGAWILTASATPWLLSMAINTRIGFHEGGWRVNHPFEFVIVSAATWVITYVALRVSLRSVVYEMRATLQDLLAEALEATPGVAEVRRRTRGWMALLVLLLTLSVAAGLWLWWSHRPGAG